MAALLTALTLSQLFVRQAQLNADHERIRDARNGSAPGSFDWDLNNEALTGTMQDLADVAAEITARILAELQETTVASTGRPLTHVPMACTTCGQPVTETGPGIWQHAPRNDDCQVVRLGGIIKARVDA